MPFQRQATRARQHNNQAYTRDDIGHYVRSSWEANFARLLKRIGLLYQYEPRTFRFEKITRGNMTYTPDFYITFYEYYVEIKGYMDADSKTKLKRMFKYYPDVPVMIVSTPVYREIEHDLSFLVSEWEYGTTKARMHAEKRRDAGSIMHDETAIDILIGIILRHQSEEVKKIYESNRRKDHAPAEPGRKTGQAQEGRRKSSSGGSAGRAQESRRKGRSDVGKDTRTDQG